MSSESRQTVIPHTVFSHGCRDLRAALLAAMPGSVIFLVGVSGSGKTWIRHTVARELFGDPSKWPKGKIPYVEVMALLTDRGFFSPKDLALALHAQINSPKIAWLYREPAADRSPFQAFERDVAGFAENWKKERTPKLEREGWREAIECGIGRGVKVFSIEHASLMVQNRVNGEAVQHTLNLMSTAVEMGSVVLLTTTPEGYGLWAKYSEICTRATRIFINPYRLEFEADLKNFSTLVKHLSIDISFEPRDLPLLLIDAIADATQTAPRGVRNILLRAKLLATTQGKSVVDLKTLKAAFPSQDEVRNISSSAELLRNLQIPYEHPAFGRATKASK